ncbi:hypothetical protein ACFL34_00500 [Candidatus Sumerlaeota bacterium]
MPEEETEEPDADQPKRNKWIWIVSVVVFFLLGVFVTELMVVFAFIVKVSYTVEQWGQFGDSFGLLNAMFSGLALVGVIIALAFQSKELSAQIKEMQDSNIQFTKQSKIFADQMLFNAFTAINNRLSNNKSLVSRRAIMGTLYMEAVGKAFHSAMKSDSCGVSEREIQPILDDVGRMGDDYAKSRKITNYHDGLGAVLDKLTPSNKALFQFHNHLTSLDLGSVGALTAIETVLSDLDLIIVPVQEELETGDRLINIYGHMIQDTAKPLFLYIAIVSRLSNKPEYGLGYRTACLDFIKPINEINV